MAGLAMARGYVSRSGKDSFYVEVGMGKFVAVEGLDGTGKSTLVCKLAKSLAADLLRTPPDMRAPDLFPGKDLRALFDKCDPVRRRAYYRAANLVASEAARVALERSHVVMDRYWTSTYAYAALDDDGSDRLEKWAGRYPLELLEPNAVVLLTASGETRRRRMSGRGRPLTDEEERLHDREQRVIERYREFGPLEVNTDNRNPAEVLQDTLDALSGCGIEP